jgi:uncharacterized protein (DUF2384 family)
METLTAFIPAEGNATVEGKNVSRFIRQLAKVAGVSERTLAQAVTMAESQLSRMAANKKGAVRAQTLYPLRRVALLVEEAGKTLSEPGVKEWLSTPNPYLDDVPPILHVRSDKELEKALNVLASIRHGFPA